MTNVVVEIIGRNEFVDLPDCGFEKIPAKIDTGAYHCSVHASDIHVVNDKDGKSILVATILGHPQYGASQKREFHDFDRVEVKSSNGHKANRYSVTLRMHINDKIIKSRFTLADRSKNVFPILIGRRTLRSRFLVDVCRAGVDRSELIALIDGEENNDDQEE